MSIILAESVAVSKSKLLKGFNGDSLNLNGRVVSVDGADKGFKAAGNVKPPYTAVISSSNRKGFANGAVTAFNDYVNNISENIGESKQMFNSYFDDMKVVTEKCEIPDSTLSIGAVTVCENSVIAAKTGNTHLLRYSDGELFEIALSDENGGFGYQLIENVLNGDIFALISDEAAENLDYEGIINIFDSGKELKAMVSDFFKLLPVADGKDCTVVLIKLNVKSTPVDVPVEAAVVPETVVENIADNDASDDNDEGLEDFATQQANKLGKKKILGLIPILALVVIIAIAVGLYVASNYDFNNNNEDSSDDVPAYQDSTDEETTTEAQSQDDTSEVETTTAEEETTTEPDETTTERQEETATQAPETTTEAPETTTQPPVTTTQPPVTTTEPPVTTTEPPVTTTEPPVTTTEPPETTTERPTLTPPDWWDIDEPYYGI